MALYTLEGSDLHILKYLSSRIGESIGVFVEESVEYKISAVSEKILEGVLVQFKQSHTGAVPTAREIIDRLCSLGLLHEVHEGRYSITPKGKIFAVMQTREDGCLVVDDQMARIADCLRIEELIKVNPTRLSEIYEGLKALLTSAAVPADAISNYLRALPELQMIKGSERASGVERSIRLAASKYTGLSLNY